MRRDLVYLIGLIANAYAAFYLFDFWETPSGWCAITIGAALPPVAYLRGTIRPALIAPPVIIALWWTLPFGFEALGAECPIEGMDYLEQCNDLAEAAMVVTYGGLYLLMVSGIAMILGLIVGSIKQLARAW